MKKRIRNIPLQFFVSQSEADQITANMERNGLSNLSEFLRILALSKAEIIFSVRIPNVVHVSQAELGEGGGEERTQERANG